MSPENYIVPGSTVVFLVGVYWIARNTITAMNGARAVVRGEADKAASAAVAECVSREACDARHDRDERHLSDGLRERRESTHALRDELAALSNRVHALDKRSALADERQRWIVSALESVMRTTGANGVPPPPKD